MDAIFCEREISFLLMPTDRRVGLWLQLYPEKAAEPGSLGRQGPLGTSDLVVLSRRVARRSLTAVS